MTLYFWESPNNKIHLLRIMKENMARHGEIYDINCKIEKTEKEKILHRRSSSFNIGSWLWSFHLKLFQRIRTKKHSLRTIIVLRVPTGLAVN